ncbi:inner nuclear membrane protein Man1-like isoform X2 [Saccostrea echinata]|uniref:inner nuclear membrane protein Man1-like isoform X2 n=1 Tax=Saccostrea echinata TaxID=191078 RepID=UPI002A8150F7|nr:inner nuclear membrane protein Man1-like isoform X2 [Saccostrea echinata]
MAEKITDEELVEELKAYGEVVKVPIDKKKRPILIKKLNHFRARDRPANQGKKTTPSRSRQTKNVEFSSAEESEDETVVPIKRMTARQAPQKEAVSSYSKTDTIEISPPRTRTGSRRSTRRSGVGGSSSDSVTPAPSVPLKSLYPDLSREIGGGAVINSSVNYSYEYQNEFTDSDPDESMYEVENKSMNTTFQLQDSFVDNYKSPLGHSVKQRRSVGRGNSRKTENNTAWPEYSRGKLNNITDNREEDEHDNHIDHSYEPKASFISTSILCLVVCFFLIVGATYIYLRQDIGSTHFGQGDGDVVYPKGRNKIEYEEAHQTVVKIEEYLRNKGNGEMIKWETLNTSVTGSESEMKKAKELILLNPKWGIRAFDAEKNPVEASDTQENEDKITYLQTDPDLGLIIRVWRSMEKILFGLTLLVICVGVVIVGFFSWRYHRGQVEREQKCVFELVEKIIDLVKDNYELHQENNRHPEFIAVSHVRDQLLPPKQRQKLRPRWEKAVKFIEANESRIRIENQTVQGEDFLVWRWLPACSNGGKYWQGQAFGENNTSSGGGGALSYSPTPCLKIRNMFDAEMETDEDWEVNVQDAILEKCKGIKGILHIYVDSNSKEGCVYIKCNSCETAYSVYKSLHGWWFDGRLVTVKYLRLELYHNKFPDSRRAQKSLQPSNSKMASLAQPYHRSTLEMT